MIMKLFLFISLCTITLGSDKNDNQEEKKEERPEMRLYRIRHLTKKGNTPIPDELNTDPIQTGQLVEGSFGFSPNCARAPLERAAELFDTEWYFPQVESILVIHDRCGSASDLWVTDILEALRMRHFWENYNILAVDFPGFMCEIKDKVRDIVGMKTDFETVTLQLKRFFEAGTSSGKIQLNHVNMIGLGLGALVAGSVARTLKSSGNTIKSIVGLNPSTFQDIPPVCKDDGSVVQLLHTYSKDYGTDKRVGSADFVFNGAHVTQPNCNSEELDCSHTRCFKIFAAVIVFTSRFQAWRCTSWKDFILDGAKCSQDFGYLFYPPDETLQGTYYLRIGSRFPFGLGEDGRKFDDQTMGMEYVPGYKPTIIKRPSKDIRN